MIKVIGDTRKMDRLGRLVIPFEVRKKFNIQENDDIEIIVDEEKGHIILRKPFKECCKCQSTVSLKEVTPNCFLCEDYDVNPSD